MTDHPGSEHSSAERPTAAFTPPPRPSAPRGPETVINPERRAATAAAYPELHPESSIRRQLFPLEADMQDAPVGPAGCELGHFVIERRIGAGGMGAVFQAHDTRLDRPVALKVLAPGRSQEDGTVERFYNEARAAARLDHDNIARVYYIGQDRGMLFIAYEFVTGPTLRDLIQQHGQLDPAEAVNYTLQIAAALNHTATAGIVHRDIKPSNIIVAPNGRAKLVDLGLARKRLAEGAAELTVAGTTLGTFDYIAPEQAKDPRRADVRSDIYSLGCTLYHMLTGEPPYPEGTVLQKLLDHQASDTPDPSKRNPRVPPELAAIVRKMMASDPDRRYLTPDELVRDLMFVAGRIGLRAVNPEGLIWALPRVERLPFWQKNAGLIVTTAVLLLFVVGLTFFPELGRRREEVAQEPPREAVVPPPAEITAANPKETKDTSSEVRVATAEPNATNTSPADAFSTPAEPANGTNSETNGSRKSNGPSITPLTTEQPTDNAERVVDVKTPVGPFSRQSNSPGVDSTVPPLVTNEGPVRPLQDIIPEVFTKVFPGTVSEPESDPPPAVAKVESLTANETKINDIESENVATITEPNSTTPPDEPVIALLLKDAREAKTFPTLEAACAEAADRSVIELRYNGDRQVIERPIQINNKRISIRAARGFRPLLKFASELVPGQGYETRMITVNAGGLELNNVDIKLAIDSSVRADQWAVFSVQGYDSVRLNGVTVTVVNPENRPAAVFELTPGPGGGSGMDLMDNATQPGNREFVVEMTESIVRGETDLSLITHTRPGRINLEQSLVATEGPLVRTRGNSAMRSDSAAIEITIKHVTAILQSGLLQVELGTEPRSILPVRIEARNNIFASAADQPFVSMSGNIAAPDFERLLRWDGTDNFYEGFNQFWDIKPEQAMADAVSYGYEDWEQSLESILTVGEERGGVIWKGQPFSRPLDQIEPIDVALDREAPLNLAVEGAADGSDIGVDLNRLPRAAPQAVSAVSQ